MRRIILLLIALLMTAACATQPAVEEETHDEDEDHAAEVEADLPSVEAVDLAEGERLQVVASTNIVGDVVRNIAGDAIELTVLMEPGQDPHTYETSAQDIAAMEDAHIVFVNGLGFEEGIGEVLEEIETPVAPLSADNMLIEFGGHDDDHDDEEGEHDEEEGDHADEEDEHSDEEGDHDHEHGSMDPHTWMNPENVIIWAQNAEQMLSALDPANAETYDANLQAYLAELSDLTAYIEQQVDSIPEENRVLVTDHDALGYFAERFGFEVAGTIVPAGTTAAEPSARAIAELVETIEAEQAPAIFVGTTVSDDLAQTIAEELGYEIGIYALYTGSLSDEGGEAATYIDMMRANIDTIVEALSL